MKTIFKVSIGNRETLQLAQVDTGIGDPCQDHCEAATRMVRMKTQGCLISTMHRAGDLFALQDQETRVIIFQGVNVGSDHVQIEEFRGQFACNCCDMFAFMLMNQFRTQRSVFGFNQFPIKLVEVFEDIAGSPSGANELPGYPEVLLPD